MRTSIKSRPTRMSSVAEALLRNRFQMSIVKRVDPELKVAVSDDIKAASMTARRRPFRPEGIIRITSVG